MPRTLNPTTHSVRRDAFLDAAERLIRTRGYDAMSVQDVLDELGASKGAFYHYFDSKEALLGGVIERMTDDAMAVIEPIAADPGLPALEKLQAVFSVAGRWKTDRSDLLLALTRSWYGPQNDLVRCRFARAGTARLVPLLARIIRQGTAEGTFDPVSGEQTAAILVGLLSGSSDSVGQLVLERLDDRISYEEAERCVAAYGGAIERILGLPAGSVVIVDPNAMQAWFA